MNFIRLSISTILLSIIAACGGAGGDSGEAQPDDEAIAAVSKLAGLWNLPGNWRDETSNDEAVLVIRSPDTNGEAKAIIYDFDDSLGGNGNCYLIDAEGILMQSFDDRLFLDLPPVYDSAIAQLQPDGKQLKISTVGTEPARDLIATFRGVASTENENELNICAP